MNYMERYLGDLKSFVRNRRRYPEGSIAEAYVAKEGLTFCSRYLSSAVDTGMNRMTRNSDDTPSIGHPIGGKKLVSFDHKALNQAHGYILFNCDEVQEYIRYNHLLPTSFHCHNKVFFFCCIEKLVIYFVESMKLMFIILKKKESPTKLSIKEKILFNGLKHVSWMRK